MKNDNILIHHSAKSKKFNIFFKSGNVEVMRREHFNSIEQAQEQIVDNNRMNIINKKSIYIR